MRAFLVRHATCDPVGHSLAGRAPGVQLNPEGRRQATAVGARLDREQVHAIYTSPLERAVETASAIALATGAPVTHEQAFIEIDFGDWTGREIEALAADEHWTRFNTHRSGVRPPGGELAIDVQARAVRALYRIADAHPDQTVVVVSHADVIRAMLTHALGMSVDLQHRLAIAPASCTTLELSPWGATLTALNECMT